MVPSMVTTATLSAAPDVPPWNFSRTGGPSAPSVDRPPTTSPPQINRMFSPREPSNKSTNRTRQPEPRGGGGGGAGRTGSTRGGGGRSDASLMRLPIGIADFGPTSRDAGRGIVTRNPRSGYPRRRVDRNRD